MGLFGQTKPVDPKEQVRGIKKTLRMEQRKMDRSINQITREENKVKRSLQEAAKKGDKDVCKILAKEVVGSKRAVQKLQQNKVQINSIMMQMDNQVSMMRVTKSLQKSTEVMKLMGRLTKLPEMQQTMMELQREMMKAGIIEEMMDDVMDQEDEELEEDAEAEIEKVLFEITKGQLGTDTAMSTPLAGPSSEIADSVEVEEEESEEEDEMAARLAALRS